MSKVYAKVELRASSTAVQGLETTVVTGLLIEQLHYYYGIRQQYNEQHCIWIENVQTLNEVCVVGFKMISLRNWC
jgi:hypothetical protein